MNRKLILPLAFAALVLLVGAWTLTAYFDSHLGFASVFATDRLELHGGEPDDGASRDQLARAARYWSDADRVGAKEPGWIAFFRQPEVWGRTAALAAVPIALVALHALTILAAVALNAVHRRRLLAPARLSAPPAWIVPLFGLAVLGIAIHAASITFVDTPAGPVRLIDSRGVLPVLGSLVGHLLAPAVTLFGVVLVVAALGYRIRAALGLRVERRLDRLLFSVSLGLAAFSMALFALGLLGLYSRWPILILAAVILALLRRNVIEVLVDTLAPVRIEWKPLALTPLFLLLLLGVTATGATDLVRPLPLGWDDMGYYLNLPRQAAVGGSIVGFFDTQAWLLVVGVGYAIWGAEPAGVGTMTASYLAWTGGVLALIATLGFCMRFFTLRAGAFAALFLASLPMFVWMTTLDMKVDPALLFISIMTLWAALELLRCAPEQRAGWALAVGLLVGFAWVIKATTVFLVVGLLAATLAHLGVRWKVGGWRGEIRRIATRTALGFLVLAAPWAIKNVIEALHFTPGAVDWTSADVYVNGPDLSPSPDFAALGIDRERCPEPTAYREEVERYFGGDEDDGLAAYVRLPWKLLTNATVRGFHVTLSPLVVAAPLLWLGAFFSTSDRRGRHETVAAAALGAVVLPCLVVGFGDALRLSWLSSAGVLVVSALLGGSAVAAHSWTRRGGNDSDDGRDVAFLVLVGVAGFAAWAATAEGVPWYGIQWLFLVAVLVGLVAEQARRMGPVPSIAFVLIYVLATAPLLVLRGEKFANPMVVRFAAGSIPARTTIEPLPDGTVREVEGFLDRFLPGYSEIAARVSASPGALYRIGTFIEYFIDDNHRRVFRDLQLDTWSCMNHDGDGEATRRRLRAAGFEYVAFDPTTPTIEKDPTGTLHQKVRRFLDWAEGYTTTVFRDPNGRIVLLEIPDVESE